MNPAHGRELLDWLKERMSDSVSCYKKTKHPPAAKRHIHDVMLYEQWIAFVEAALGDHVADASKMAPPPAPRE